MSAQSEPEAAVTASQGLDGGVRYHKLLSVLDRSLSSVVDTFKLEDLREIFPDLADEIPQKLSESHEQISSYLRNSTNADFQAILMQYDMATKLTALDTLVREAAERKQNKQSNRNTNENSSDNSSLLAISPESINRGRSVAIKRAELTRLKGKLATLKSENAQYMAEFENQRVTLATEQKRMEATQTLVNQVDSEPLYPNQ